MSTRLLVLAAVLGLGVFATAAGAAGGNPNRGKSLFKSTCKTCHVKGGDAKDLTPMSKTQAQWERAYKNTFEAMARRVEKKNNKALKPSELDDIRTFLVAHAADSDQPETCGVK